MNTAADKLADVLTAVEKGRVNAITVVKDMTGDKMDATIKVESSPVEPVRSESPARSHVFHEAGGFVKYLEKNKTDNMVILTDTDNRQVVAVMDDVAKTGFENIELCPALHPQFKTLLQTILAKQACEVPIGMFAKRVMMCKDIIVSADNLNGKQLAMQMMQITVSHKITACAGIGVSATNGIMCVTDVKSGTDHGEKVELPETITVELPIFIKTDPVKFDVEILIMTSGPEDPPVVIAMAPQMEEKIAEVFETLLGPVKKITGAIVSYGQPSTTPWKYIG